MRSLFVRQVRFLAVFVMLASMIGLPTAMAQGPDGGPQAAVPQSGWDYTEGGYLEVGVHASNWAGTGSYLPCAFNNIDGLYYYLTARGWSGHHNWKNGNNWETDWKRAALGGSENSWVDAVDLEFYEGHGWPGGFTFWPASGTAESLVPNEAYMSWGNNDAEWIGLLSCSVLGGTYANYNQWAWAMNELHLLMGFATTAYDVCGFGQRLAERIEYPYQWYIANAWMYACDTKQPQGVVARILAEHPNYWYDTKNYQYPDSWDNYYNIWTHTCGSEPARPVANLEAITQMPVFNTPPMNLAEATPVFNNLATIFGVPTQTVKLVAGTAAGEQYLYSSNGVQDLEMHVSSGEFYYVDHSQEVFTPTLGAGIAATLTPSDAVNTANAFLLQSGLMPGDAQFFEVAPDLVSSAYSPGRAAGSAAAAVAAAEPAAVTDTTTSYAVIYSRQLAVPAALQSAVPAESFSAIGPGAKLKIAVNPAGAQAVAGSKVSAAQAAGIQAAQGGWRHLSNTAINASIQATVTILPFEQINILFQKMEKEVALAAPPVPDPISKAVLTPTLAYWEEPSGTGQAELFPAYALYATYTSGDPAQVTLGWSYIVANNTYMRPYAKITVAPSPSQNVRVGQSVHFEAADATKTLAELDPVNLAGLNFKMGNGPFTYDWYLGSVADENYLGTSGPTRTFDWVVTGKGLEGKTVPVPLNVILVVTDQNTKHVSQSTSAAITTFPVVPNVFLPLVSKNF